MDRKKCYCGNKFCKCLFGCGCTVYGIKDPSAKASGSEYEKCMCCLMKENDKKIDRKRRNGKCNCNFDDPKFYDIIIFNVIEKVKYYWSCRYGCKVTISGGSFNEDEWRDGAVDKNKSHKGQIQIRYDSSNIKDSNVNILIIKEDNLSHVWCNVSSINS